MFAHACSHCFFFFFFMASAHVWRTKEVYVCLAMFFMLCVVFPMDVNMVCLRLVKSLVWGSVQE